MTPLRSQSRTIAATSASVAPVIVAICAADRRGSASNARKILRTRSGWSPAIPPTPTVCSGSPRVVRTVGVSALAGDRTRLRRALPVAHGVAEQRRQIIGAGQARRQLSHPVLRQRPFDQRRDIRFGEADRAEAVR